MTLPVPVLDDRTFQDIVDECKRMIPRYTPEWTDHNVSDPGVTLIELFAWMTELLLYRMNQVPTRNYIKFLELIGVRLEPPHSARTEVLFRLTAPREITMTIPAGTEVATVRTDVDEAIVFATDERFDIVTPVLDHTLVSRDGFNYLDYEPALRNPNLRVPIFEEPPQPGNSFYLGYRGNMAAHTLLLRFEAEIEGIGVDPRRPPLSWDYYDGSVQDWRPMEMEEDTTGGLNRPGHVIVHIPRRSRPRELDRRRATWIRCRVLDPAPGQRPYTSSPRIVGLTTQSIGGSASASHSEVIGTEMLGRSDGTPGQTFHLAVTPVLPRRDGETLEVETEIAGQYEPWHEVEDFSSSGADDPHFTCDSVSGQILLGPTIRLPSGVERRHGLVPPQGRAVRFTRYRTGGGTVGNVGKGTLTVLKTSLPYILWVKNIEPALGGSEAETLDAALLRGPRILRTSPRAVTAEDYERLALEASVEVARARCIYAREADDGLAGSVRVMLVPRLPTTDGPVPPDQLALRDDVRTTVQAYLDARRMITVRMVLEQAAYLPVSVRIDVYARPRANKAQLQTAVERALYRFLHPTVGGPDGVGWPFERPLFASDIYGLVQAVPNVEHVGVVHLLQADADGNLQPIADDTIVPPADTLLCSATHRVTVK